MPDAMNLVAEAQRVVVMEHTGQSGTPTFLHDCLLPLTAAGVGRHKTEAADSEALG